MEPLFDIEGNILARIRSDSAVKALIGSNKVFDAVQASNVEPYISLGPTSYDEEYTDCIRGGEFMVQIDCWSTKTTRDEVRAMAGAVRKALRTDITLDENALVTLEHWRTDYLTDGTTRHASVRFTGVVEES